MHRASIRWTDTRSDNTSSSTRKLSIMATTLHKRPAAVKGPVASGPSSFKRRELLAASSVSTSSQAGEPASDNTAADGMARRLTRFYTASFERRPVVTLWCAETDVQTQSSTSQADTALSCALA